MRDHYRMPSHLQRPHQPEQHSQLQRPHQPEQHSQLQQQNPPRYGNRFPQLGTGPPFVTGNPSGVPPPRHYNPSVQFQMNMGNENFQPRLQRPTNLGNFNPVSMPPQANSWHHQFAPTNQTPFAPSFPSGSVLPSLLPTIPGNRPFFTPDQQILSPVNQQFGSVLPPRVPTKPGNRPFPTPDQQIPSPVNQQFHHIPFRPPQPRPIFEQSHRPAIDNQLAQITGHNRSQWPAHMQSHQENAQAMFNRSSPKCEMEDKGNIMKNKVQQWINSRNIDQAARRVSKNLLKLHEFQDLMSKYITKLEELRNLNDLLAGKMETSKDEWTELKESVYKVKCDVSRMQSKLFNQAQVDSIAIVVRERKKKRDSIRRKRKRLREEYIGSLKGRIQWNETIDEWQNKEQTKHVMEKIDENLKNEAGESLVEVKRKQSDATEHIAIFNKLAQLRTLRKKTAIFKGILVTEKDDLKFNSKIEEINDLLRTQLKVYESEERALRVLREEEAQEISRKEKEERKRRKRNREDELNNVDPLLFFRSYWLQGEETIPSFIHVRQLWDMHLCPPDCPGSSTVPNGWIKPIELNSGWRTAIHKSKREKT